MASSKISDNVLIQSRQTNRQLLLGVENKVQQIQFLLDDLDDLSTRVICKHTIDILRVIDEVKCMDISNVGLTQILVRVADSTKQILLHLDDLDDPKTRKICKHAIDLLKAAKQTNMPFPQDVRGHGNAGSSGAVIQQGSLQVRQPLRQQDEQNEPKSISPRVELKPFLPTNMSKVTEIKNNREGGCRPPAIIVQVNPSKRAAPEIQETSPSKKLRPLALKASGSVIEGKWVTIYIGRHNKAPLNLSWLPDRMKNLILNLRDNLQDNYYYRNGNALANEDKPTTCWLSMYDAPMALRSLSNFEALPSDAGPCGMCRERAELGEKDVVCFYFATLVMIKAFQVTCLA